MFRISRSVFRVVASAIVVGAIAGLPAGASLAAQSSPGAVPNCSADATEIWMGIPGDGAAGSTFYPLEFTNVSHRTCRLFGFPGVSAVRAGRQVGSAAGRQPSTPHQVILRPGVTAHANLQVVDVLNFPRSACRPVQADSLRVFAPNERSVFSIPLPVLACSRRGVIFMFVRPVVAGVGVPGQD